MNLLSCLKGWVRLFQGLLLFGLAGCSSVFQGEKPYKSEIPLSNVNVGEIVIERALENAGLPRGHGIEVIYQVDGASKASNLLEIIALEFLLRNGYRIVENKQPIPKIRFSLDTLYVNLDIKRTKSLDKIIRRDSEARIGAVFQETSGLKKIYKGRGVYQDIFSFQMLDSVGDKEPFVTVFSAQDGIAGKVKPFFLGITISALTWLIYSYRG